VYINLRFIVGKEMCTLLTSLITVVHHDEQFCRRCEHSRLLKAHRRPLRHNPDGH